MEEKVSKQQRIYTKTGDLGETSLLGGARVAKDQLRIELCGQVDELSAVLGLARAEGIDFRHAETILRIQRELLQFGTEVACTTPVPFGARSIGQEHVLVMEKEIDEIETFLPPFTHFVIPGADKGSACLHLARTVCRRAERGLVALIRNEPDVSQTLLSYLNRLSDLLFVMARREELLRSKR